MRLCATQPKPWIGWRRSRATDSCIFAQEEFIGVKSLALPSVLANTRRPVMETVWVFDIWKIQRKTEEKVEKIGGRCAEDFSFAILFCGGFELKRFIGMWCSIFLTCASYAFQICPAFICPIFWTPFCLWYQREISVVNIDDECKML